MFPTFKQRLDTIRTRLRSLGALVFSESHPLPPLEYRAEGAADWTPIAAYSYWGTWQTRFEMRGSFAIPRQWKTSERIALHLPIGNSEEFIHPEALVFIDDTPLAAVDMNHQLFILPRAFKSKGQHTLRLSGWTGLGGSLEGDMKQRLYMRQPALVQHDQQVSEFITLARAAIQAIESFDEQHPARYDLLAALEAAFAVISTVPPLTAAKANIAAAHDVLKRQIATSEAPHPLTLHAVGHAHIDTAWLWTTATTEGKVDRSFHTVLHLMDEYPEYIFGASQPQLYDWFRQAYPDSFARIQKRVKEGRWELLSGQWIESDGNVTGAESLVRQFMLGRKFYMEHFGEKALSKILFLPDTFGFPASLPQIAAQAGMEYFFTIKLRWNEVNEFPYDTFWWQGIDGSRLLAHMSTVPWAGRIHDAATYNADPNPPAALAAWIKLKNKHERDVLMAYGWGDGGGGPTRDMLDMIRALKEFPGVPRHKTSRAGDFFALLKERYGSSAKTWKGELYLETHQGTLTSQNRIKRWNHDAEELIHDVEFLATYASLIDPAYIYPHRDLNRAWQHICLNQFHDILPGSSINEVYVEAGQRVVLLMERLNALKQAALDAIAAQYDADLLAINTLSQPRHDLLSVAGAHAGRYAATDKAIALEQDVEGARLLQVDVPALGVLPLWKASGKQQAAKPVHVEPNVLENAHIRAEFDDSARLTRLREKLSGRELIPAGQSANRLAAYEDRPANFPAWNIDPTYATPFAYAEAVEPPRVVEEGPLRSTIEFKLKLLGSTITQRVSLGNVSEYGSIPQYGGTDLLFDTQIDWQDRLVLLKAEFPVAIQADEATYGIQWGHIKRPTGSNTSWHAAQWEVAHHGWFSVEDRSAAVILYDDGIYGSSVRDNVMALTLIKRGGWPDADGDGGPRRLRYGLSARSLLFRDITAQLAADLNHPLLSVQTKRKPQGTSAPAITGLIGPDSNLSGATIQTVKRSEDNQAIIFRLYESTGAPHPIAIQFGFPVESVYKTDLHERVKEEVRLRANGLTVDLPLRPFEIVTLRVVPKT